MIYETVRSVQTAGDVVTLELAGPIGKSDKLRIKTSMIGALAMALKGLQSHFNQKSGGSIDIQALNVTSIRKAVHHTGVAMLELRLDGVRTQMLLPPESLAALRTIPAELETLTSPVAKGPRH